MNLHSRKEYIGSLIAHNWYCKLQCQVPCLLVSLKCVYQWNSPLGSDLIGLFCVYVIGERSEQDTIRGNKWKWALKMIFLGSGSSSFLWLSLLLQRNMLYRKSFTTSSRCLGVEMPVESACTTVTNFCSEGKVMLLSGFF